MRLNNLGIMKATTVNVRQITYIHVCFVCNLILRAQTFINIVFSSPPIEYCITHTAEKVFKNKGKSILSMEVHWKFVAGEAIQCYQCSSGQDPKGEDSCGAYKKFDKSRHIAIECNSDESYTPGSFCMKITQQGPKGFICKFC